MEANSDCRESVATAQTVDNFVTVIQKLKYKYLPYHLGELMYGPQVEGTSNSTVEICDYNLYLPPWICQPYVRMTPSEHIQKMQDKQNEAKNRPEELKRQYQDSEGNAITRKKMKKLRRIERRPQKETQPPRPTEICQSCPNPAGTKCLNKLCKVCCRNKCYLDNLDCPGHRILIKTRREIAKKLSDQKISECDESAAVTPLSDKSVELL